MLKRILTAAVALTIVGTAAAAATGSVEAVLLTAKGKVSNAQYREAEQLYRDLLNRIGGRKAATHNAAMALNGLGTVMQMTGRPADAEKLYRRAMEAEERSAPGSTAALNVIRNNLASTYFHLNRLDEAERLHRQVLADRERVSGAYASGTAITLNNLAEVIRSRGRAAEALPLAERSVSVLEGFGDPGSQVLLSDSLHTLGRIRMDLGDTAEAEQAFERSRRLRETALGTTHPKYADSLLSLAGVLTASQRLDDAEALLLTAIRVLEAAQAPASTAIAYNNLAQVYKLKGLYSEAEPLYRRALAIWTHAGDTRNPTYVLTLSAYADMLRCAGRVSGALQTYQQALDIAEKQLGPNHPASAAIRQDLAALRTGLVQARSTVSAQSLRDSARH